MTLQKGTLLGHPIVEDDGAVGTPVLNLTGDGGDVVASNAARVAQLQSIDIRRYGATSGEADSTSYIQACITAATTAGVAALIPAGTWISETLTLPSNSHLIIADGATLTLKASTDDALIENSDAVGGNTNIHITCFGTLNGNGGNNAAGTDIFYLDNIAGLIIDGDATVTAAQDIALHIENCSNVQVHNFHQTASTGGSGCRVRDCSNVRFRNCSFNLNVGTEGYGVILSVVDGVNDHIQFVDCNFDDNDDEGIALYSGSTDVRFIRCTSSSGNGSGVHIAGTCSEVYFESCKINDNANEGLSIYPASGDICEVTVVNCMCNDNTGRGIVAHADYITLIGNTVARNGVQGIFLYYKTPLLCLISNNRVYDNGLVSDRAGIYLNGATGAVVIGNVCYDDQGTATQTYGIEEINTCGVNYYYNNLAYRNKTGGFSLQGTAVEANNNTVARV